MKHLIIIIVLFVTRSVFAQTNYEKEMQQAFNLLDDHKWHEAEQLFEHIALAEQDHWLPNYYVARLNSLKTWEEKDVQKVASQLKKAQDYLDKALALEKDNVDLMVMQAQIWTNWVVFDGMTYGMQYAAKISELYDKAYALAPLNPMVVLSKAEWQMGSARFFGQDARPFCKDVKKAIELFINFKPETPWHPNWGRDRAEMILKSCNEQPE